MRRPTDDEMDTAILWLESNAGMTASPDTLESVRRYTDLAEDKARHGSMTVQEWEHARSYAVEALTGLLMDNPDQFDYAARMAKVREKAGRK